MTNVKPGTCTSFWLFSLEIYQRKQVKEICLSLQDQYEFNVNFILAALWTAYWQQPVSRDDFEYYRQQLSPFDMDIIQPLRRARRATCGEYGFESGAALQIKSLLKEQLLAAEIAAEKIFQQQLETLILNNCQGMKTRIGAIKDRGATDDSCSGSKNFKAIAEKNLYQYALILNNKTVTDYSSHIAALVNKIAI